MLDQLDIDGLTPLALWRALNEDTQQLAAESMYQDSTSRQEADFLVCQAIRFRPAAIKQLPVAKRVAYLRKNVRVDEHIASSMLLALHMNHRRPLLESFLDDLNIPNEAGMIDEDYELNDLDSTQVEQSAAKLYESFPKEDVQTYLACLLAMDPEIWKGVASQIHPAKQNSSA